MAILYADQYEAMRGLGKDERYVLYLVAEGHTLEEMDALLAKRADRDTSETAGAIRDRVIEKLGLASYSLAERLQRAGRMHFDYRFMLDTNAAPRDSKPPEEKPMQQISEDESADLVAPQSRASLSWRKRKSSKITYNMDDLALKVSGLREEYRQILRVAVETQNIQVIARRCGKKPSTVRIYVSKIAKALGLYIFATIQDKLAIEAEAYKLAYPKETAKILREVALA